MFVKLTWGVVEHFHPKCGAFPQKPACVAEEHEDFSYLWGLEELGQLQAGFGKIHFVLFFFKGVYASEAMHF